VERPFSKADMRRFGAESPPEGPILAVSVADLADKEAVLASGEAAFFTIAHFDGYAAVLIQLKLVAGRATRGDRRRVAGIGTRRLAEEYLQR